MRSPRPSRTRLACRSSPSSRHRAPGWPPPRGEAGQVDRRDRVSHAAIFAIPGHRLPSARNGGRDCLLGSRPRPEGVPARPAGPEQRPGRYRSTRWDRCCGGHGTASPAVPTPRPGPCTRTRTGRCRGHPARSHAARRVGRVASLRDRRRRPLTLARAARAGVHAAPGAAGARPAGREHPAQGDSAGIGPGRSVRRQVGAVPDPHGPFRPRVRRAILSLARTPVAHVRPRSSWLLERRWTSGAPSRP